MIEPKHIFVNKYLLLLGNVPFKVITAIFNFYIPTTCMVVLYVKIFLAIKRRSKEMEKITAFQGISIYSIFIVLT